jgi:hypothetical protein
MRLAFTGAALAILPWLHTRYAVVAGALGALILARLLLPRAERGVTSKAVAFLGIPVLSAACWFGFFSAIYGSPDPRGPYGSVSQNDIANLSRGVVGLLFDQQFGLLPAAPVLLCALAGLRGLLVCAPRLTAELVLVVALYGLVVGSFQMWWGGSSSPARFIVPILLPLAIPAGGWFASRRGLTGRLLGLGALTVSLIATVTVAIVDHGILLYNVRDGASRLLTWLSPLANLSSALPSVFQTTPVATFANALIWIGAIALTAAAGVYVERRGGRPLSVVLALGFSALVSASVAVQVVWWNNGQSMAATDQVSVITPMPATVALLRRYDVDSRQFGVRYGAPHRVRLRDMLTELTLAHATDRAGEGTAIAVAHLPAGVYALEGSGGGSELSVSLDSEVDSQWRWQLDESPSPWRRELHLPVPVRLVLAKAPDAYRLAIRPVSITGSSQRLTNDEPVQTVRYGSTLAFLIGGHAFMDPGGIWIEGGRSAEFVVSSDAGTPFHLFVRNPPTQNTVSIQGDTWRRDLILAPGEERALPLPFRPGQTAVRFRVHAAQGARPSEFEAGSSDTRYLGCWIEPRS